MTLHLPTRLTLAAEPTVEVLKRFEPHLTEMPPLPAITWPAGLSAPTLLETPTTLPTADVVVITWAGPEWAAMQHVFCSSATSMSYAHRDPSPFTGWQRYDTDMPAGPKGWDEWGYFRLVEVGQLKVLLFKSGTHLDFPGEAALTTLADRLLQAVQPTLLLSIGTAGGASPTDHVGTIRVVSAGTMYDRAQPSSTWPTTSCDWSPSTTILESAAFQALLMPVPITESSLTTLANGLNATQKVAHSLADFDPLGLNQPDSTPVVTVQADGTESLLTASNFLVGTTDGAFKDYACIEMDDTVLAEACQPTGTKFGFVRNLSDPAQSAALPKTAQGNWGSVVYEAYGIYTSYNGALVTLALLS